MLSSRDQRELGKPPLLTQPREMGWGSVLQCLPPYCSLPGQRSALCVHCHWVWRWQGAETPIPNLQNFHHRMTPARFLAGRPRHHPHRRRQWSVPSKQTVGKTRPEMRAPPPPPHWEERSHFHPQFGGLLVLLDLALAVDYPRWWWTRRPLGGWWGQPATLPRSPTRLERGARQKLQPGDSQMHQQSVWWIGNSMTH